MDRPFQFLHLPLLVQRMILKDIDFYKKDFIKLLSTTFVSKKFKQFLHLAYLKDIPLNVICQTKSSKIIVFKFDITLIEIRCDAGGGGNRAMQITRSKQFPFAYYIVVHCAETRTHKEAAEKLTRHILSFLKTPKLALDFHESSGNRDFFLWNIVPSRKVDVVRVLSQNLALEDVDFFLEEVQTNVLRLDFKMRHETERKAKRYAFKLEKAYNHQKVIIRNADEWIDLGTILNLDVKNLELIVDASWINPILKQWIQGKTEKMNILKINYFNDIISQEQILHGIEHTRLEHSERRFFNHNRSTIRRKCDDRRAVVSIWRKTVTMTVSDSLS